MASKYEQMLSKTIEGSDIWEINHAKGAKVSFHPETFELLTRALTFSELTCGKLDLTIGSVSELWNFSSDNDTHIVPDQEQIENLLSHVDYHTLKLEEDNGKQYAYLTDPYAQIDLGFIAKGYIADQMKEYLKRESVNSAIINLGGNVLTVGSKPDGTSFKIGIRKPFGDTSAPIEVLSVSDKDKSWTFKPLISTAVGEDKTDFYYKWEIGYASYADEARTRQTGFTGWKTVWFWDAEKNPDKKTSKGKSEFTITPGEVEKLFTKSDGSNISFDDGNGNLIDTFPALLVRVSITDRFQTTTNINTNETTIIRDTIEGENDFVALQATSSVYSRTHRTFPIYYNYEYSVHDVDQYFYYIHSCTKVTSDGQKALFYDDAYNTGCWFKTVISKYNYITKNMSLSFKTTKNEKLVAVSVFDTNIIVFADNEQLGGNISVVTGNGDDYKKDDYYSPYQRKVVNTSVSCDAYNSVQQVDNYVVFKYRQDIYILDSTALSNLDTVTVETINDSVKNKLDNIELPLNRVKSFRNKFNEDLNWDFHILNSFMKPDEIFSEVYEGCYSIIFPRQGTFKDTMSVPQSGTLIKYDGPNAKLRNKYIENTSIKPGLRWKCYIRNGKMYQNASKVSYPWLRDISYLFDVVGIIHVEGQPCYIRENGDVIRFDRANALSYTADTNESFKLRITTKAYDMEAPALCKFLDSCTLYYSRDFTNINNMVIRINNEADYELYGPENEAFISLQELTDQVQFNDNISFDEMLNLNENEKPISQYDKKPYVDMMDKPVQVLNSVGLNTATLNRPNYASKTCTPRWRFPFLSCSVTIEMEGNQAFTLSALNFSYTSSDMPDFTREQLYRNIIRR